jgi:hypothetical protein
VGLSVIVSGGVVLFAMIYILLTVPGIVNQTISLTKASTDISNVENSILRTNIEMDSLSASSGSRAINFTISNGGTEKLWYYSKFNLIITYTYASGTKTESLSYAGICSVPASGTWCVESISDDNVEPNILNTDETLNVLSRVSQTPTTGTVNTTFSTDYGIVASRTAST